MKHLNPELITENWRVLGTQMEPKGQQLILIVDWDLANDIKETNYIVFNGLTEGIFKVLSNPSRDPKSDKGLVNSPATTASGRRWWDYNRYPI
jgi:hypothetical protein